MTRSGPASPNPLSGVAPSAAEPQTRRLREYLPSPTDCFFMCLVFFAHRAVPGHPLVFAGNRDEFYERLAAPAGPWEDDPRIIGGRDLQAGGTWLAADRRGRWGTLTNYRDLAHIREDAPSRGAIVRDYLQQEGSVQKYIETLRPDVSEFNGFNLILSDGEDVYYYSSVRDSLEKLAPGIYGLSNAFLESDWPKVTRGKAAFVRALNFDALPGVGVNAEAVLDVLADAEIAPDELLPSTGIPIEYERALSPLFIHTPTYGTRASSVLIRDSNNRMRLVERRFNAKGVVEGSSEHAWQFD